MSYWYFRYFIITENGEVENRQDYFGYVCGDGDAFPLSEVVACGVEMGVSIQVTTAIRINKRDYDLLNPSE